MAHPKQNFAGVCIVEGCLNQKAQQRQKGSYHHSYCVTHKKHGPEHVSRKYKFHYEPKKRRAAYLEYRYGMSITDYERMLQQQEGQCGICRVKADETARGLFIDHSHETGEPRGLLCQTCNTALGMFGDDIVTLLNAADWLCGFRAADFDPTFDTSLSCGVRP